MKRYLAPILVVVCALVFAACTSASVKPLPAAPTVKVRPTTTTFPDFSGTSIPPVKGTTTTSPPGIRGGTSSISGRVTVGGAPAAGATVRIDRFVGDQSVSADATTNNDGAYNFDNLLGGRFRVRAWRAPDATLNQPNIYFLGAGQSQTVNMSLTQFNGQLSTSAAQAPDPPLLGDVSNIAVQVTTQGVDANGTARSIGQGGLPLVLTVGPGRVITTPNPAVTNSNGVATWTVQCVALEGQGLSVTLPDGSVVPLSLSGCKIPPTTTTSTSTTVPGAH